MYQGATPTKFGRYAVAESLRPERLHLYRGEPLKEVTHELPFAALDQEDLLAQGIHTSQLVRGAQDVDALGSCTCNAGTTSLAAEWKRVRGHLPPGLSTDVVGNEKYAIKLYHEVTDQTGDPSSEWPPTDCGSTGLYVCTELEKQKLISSHKSATDAQSLVSLLQTGTVIQGTPFFNAWMEPDRWGFVDGDGSVEALYRAIDSGLAGGHETCINAVLKLKLSATGIVEAQDTILAVRNSWSSAWGLRGNFRFHLSTLAMLGSYCDFKQFVVEPA